MDWREVFARAICAADHHGWPSDDYNGRTQRRFYLAQADSVLAEIEQRGFCLAPVEPTEEMTMNGFLRNKAKCACERRITHDPQPAYRAMIQARPREVGE